LRSAASGDEPDPAVSLPLLEAGVPLSSAQLRMRAGEALAGALDSGMLNRQVKRPIFDR